MPGNLDFCFESLVRQEEQKSNSVPVNSKVFQWKLNTVGWDPKSLNPQDAMLKIVNVSSWHLKLDLGVVEHMDGGNDEQEVVLKNLS